MLYTARGRFVLLSYGEAISYLLLLGIAMPLKYMAGIPEVVSVVGAIHGGLFTFYIVAAIHLFFVDKWSIIQFGLAVVAAFLPFGPFIFDKYFLKNP
ncbi:DUF3817 domain-containing protein [Bacillus coahuilensis]|uniref:DUF3817 domain-containing protein n=1 Tax=Bacillus coahuilensis TaxID=408580 RepID=UPI0001850EEA|nr:DUF3817 domain-containing protein [Bacillus coahuilensis]